MTVDSKHKKGKSKNKGETTEKMQKNKQKDGDNKRSETAASRVTAKGKDTKLVVASDSSQEREQQL